MNLQHSYFCFKFLFRTQRVVFDVGEGGGGGAETIPARPNEIQDVFTEADKKAKADVMRIFNGQMTDAQVDDELGQKVQGKILKVKYEIAGVKFECIATFKPESVIIERYVIGEAGRSQKTRESFRALSYSEFTEGKTRLLLPFKALMDIATNRNVSDAFLNQSNEALTSMVRAESNRLKLGLGNLGKAFFGDITFDDVLGGQPLPDPNSIKSFQRSKARYLSAGVEKIYPLIRECAKRGIASDEIKFLLGTPEIVIDNPYLKMSIPDLQNLLRTIDQQLESTTPGVDKFALSQEREKISRILKLKEDLELPKK